MEHPNLTKLAESQREAELDSLDFENDTATFYAPGHSWVSGKYYISTMPAGEVIRILVDASENAVEALMAVSDNHLIGCRPDDAMDAGQVAEQLKEALSRAEQLAGGGE